MQLLCEGLSLVVGEVTSSWIMWRVWGLRVDWTTALMTSPTTAIILKMLVLSVNVCVCVWKGGGGDRGGCVRGVYVGEGRSVCEEGV